MEGNCAMIEVFNKIRHTCDEIFRRIANIDPADSSSEYKTYWYDETNEQNKKRGKKK